MAKKATLVINRPSGNVILSVIGEPIPKYLKDKDNNQLNDKNNQTLKCKGDVN